MVNINKMHCFCSAFLLGKILWQKMKLLSVKPKPLLEYSIMDKLNYRHTLVRLEITVIMCIILITLAWWQPSLAMILYLSIPIVSFFFQRKK